eukprot:8623808-Pyramimonas_sp.AAC.1
MDPDKLQKREREVYGMEKLFQVRPHRMKHTGVTDQGIWQARCDMIAAGQMRDVSREATFQEWVQEAESRMEA